MLIVCLVLVTGIYSCEKEVVKPSNDAILEISPTVKAGGDDDEDPIIQGFVKDNGVLVDSVITAIVPSGTTIPYATTSNNGFNVQVPAGTYFFEVTPQGKSTVTTDEFSVQEDVAINIHI